MNLSEAVHVEGAGKGAKSVCEARANLAVCELTVDHLHISIPDIASTRSLLSAKLVAVAKRHFDAKTRELARNNAQAAMRRTNAGQLVLYFGTYSENADVVDAAHESVDAARDALEAAIALHSAEQNEAEAHSAHCLAHLVRRKRRRRADTLHTNARERLLTAARVVDNIEKFQISTDLNWVDDLPDLPDEFLSFAELSMNRGPDSDESSDDSEDGSPRSLSPMMSGGAPASASAAASATAAAAAAAGSNRHGGGLALRVETVDRSNRAKLAAARWKASLEITNAQEALSYASVARSAVEADGDVETAWLQLLYTRIARVDAMRLAAASAERSSRVANDSENFAYFALEEAQALQQMKQDAQAVIRRRKAAAQLEHYAQTGEIQHQSESEESDDGEDPERSAAIAARDQMHRFRIAVARRYAGSAQSDAPLVMDHRSLIESVRFEIVEHIFQVDPTRPLGFGVHDFHSKVTNMMTHGISHVRIGSQAHRLGMRTHDVLVAVGGERFGALSATEIAPHLARHVDRVAHERPARKLEIVVGRKGANTRLMRSAGGSLKSFSLVEAEEYAHLERRETVSRRMENANANLSRLAIVAHDESDNGANLVALRQSVAVRLERGRRRAAAFAREDAFRAAQLSEEHRRLDNETKVEAERVADLARISVQLQRVPLLQENDSPGGATEKGDPDARLGSARLLTQWTSGGMDLGSSSGTVGRGGDPRRRTSPRSPRSGAAEGRGSRRAMLQKLQFAEGGGSEITTQDLWDARKPVDEDVPPQSGSPISSTPRNDRECNIRRVRFNDPSSQAETCRRGWNDGSCDREQEN